MISYYESFSSVMFQSKHYCHRLFLAPYPDKRNGCEKFPMYRYFSFTAQHILMRAIQNKKIILINSAKADDDGELIGGYLNRVSIEMRDTSETHSEKCKNGDRKNVERKT